MNKRIALVIAIFFSQSLWAAERCLNGSDQCLIGVFPHAGTKHIRDTYGAVAEDIAFELDVETQLTSTTTLEDFRLKLLNEKYDIALIGPGSYSGIYDEINYVPLVRPKRKVQFVIIVPESSKISTLSDLENKRVGKLERQTGTWLSTYTMLNEVGVYNKIKEFIEFGSSHECVYAIVSDRVEACGIPLPILTVIQKQIPIKFKILSTSIPLPSSLYVVHADVSDEQKNVLKKYLLQREDFIMTTKQDYKEMRQMLSKLP